MGISELIVVLIVALILIPPDKLPEVMQTVGKLLRELRLASNTVMRELTELREDPLQLKKPPPAVAQPPSVLPPDQPSTEVKPPPIQP